MKNIYFVFLFALFPLLIEAQFTSDLVVYNPFGELFKLYLDNSLVSNSYTNKIRVSDMKSGDYNLTVDFKNPTLQTLKFDVFLKANTEIACALKKNDKKLYYVDVFDVFTYTEKNNVQNIQPLPPPVLQPVEEKGVFCDVAMDRESFSLALQTIKKQSFNSEKLSVAQQVASSNCLLSSQNNPIGLISLKKSDKLDFAKFAYTHTFDPNNYYIINDEFDFSSSITRLNEYINSIE